MAREIRGAEDPVRSSGETQTRRSGKRAREVWHRLREGEAGPDTDAVGLVVVQRVPGYHVVELLICPLDGF